MSRPATRDELEGFARFLARITLEVERGHRDPDQLLRYMPARTWQQWQDGRPPGRFTGGPALRTDIGRARVELLDDRRAIASVVTATDTGRWGALTIKLDATSGAWRAVSLQRLYAARHYRTGPSQPAVPVPIERRLATAHTDRDRAAAALAAVTRRAAELPKGSAGHRQATSLSTTWRQVLADLDREISTLHRHQPPGIEVQRVRQRTR